MAAPNTYYVNNGNAAIPADKVGVLKVNHLPALFAYSGNQKSMFRLDGWITAQKGDGSATIGFIGFVRIDNVNSLNYRLHNLSKHGGIELQFPLFRVITLTDGGLNIKSNVVWDSTLSDRVNNISSKSNVDIPFHNSNVTVTMTWQLFRGGTLIAVKYATRVFNSSFQGQNSVDVVLSAIDDYQPEAGDEVTYSISTSNDQGEFYDPNSVQTIILKPALITWQYNPLVAWPSQIVANPTNSIDVRFAKAPFDIGTTFYTNDVMGITLAAGYYIDFERWYQIDITGTLIDMAYHGIWPVGDPAAPVDYVTIVHHGDRTTIINLEAYLNLINYTTGTGWDAPTTMYRSTRTDSTQNKFYTNTGLSVEVANGYYVFPYGGGDIDTLENGRYLIFYRIEGALWTERWQYDTIDQYSQQIPL